MTHADGNPHTSIQDHGQRYEVTFIEGESYRRRLAWTETKIGVQSMLDAIEAHPHWHSPNILDRKYNRLITVDEVVT